MKRLLLQFGVMVAWLVLYPYVSGESQVRAADEAKADTEEAGAKASAKKAKKANKGEEAEAKEAEGKGEGEEAKGDEEAGGKGKAKAKDGEDEEAGEEEGGKAKAKAKAKEEEDGAADEEDAKPKKKKSKAKSEDGAEAAWGGEGEGGAPEFKLPIKVHCGSVIRVERNPDPVQWRDMDRVLGMKNFKPVAGEDPKTVVQRPPGDGRVYVIVTMQVEPKRSIGRCDYVIRHKGKGGMSACLGLGWGDLPFDERNWQGMPKGDAVEVQMLFEVPADQDGGELVFALPVTLEQPSVALRFPGPKEAAAGEEKGEKEEKAEEGDGAEKAGAAKGEEAADEGKKADKQEAAAEEGKEKKEAAEKPAKTEAEAKPVKDATEKDGKAKEGKEKDAKPAPAKAKENSDWL